MCHFLENGDTVVHYTLQEPQTIQQISDITQEYVNPIIEKMSSFFVQSGYNYMKFESLYSPQVEIAHLHYTNTIELVNITKSVDISDIQSCITPVFVIKSKKITGKKGIEMRYKKVSNYNKVTAKEAYIIEQLKRKEPMSKNDIINGIISNFNTTEEDTNIIAKVAGDLMFETGGIANRSHKIKNNPGFDTTIT